MLRKIRIIAAGIFFVLATLLFLDFMGTLHRWFGWIAQIQFIPALMALNVGVVAGLLLLTLLFGRIYCSVICPLGVLQDIISRFASRWKKRRFEWSPALSWLRYTVLALFAAAFIAGVHSFVALLSPYSAYGRIAANLFAPFAKWGNNLLALIAERTDSYAFYAVEVWLPGVITLGVALLTFGLLWALAWRSGRTYCNTICPVGTILGLISRFSLFKPVIDTGRCNGCKTCARKCKASCIDSGRHTIDYSRCIGCMNCIGNCRQGAIRYLAQWPFGSTARELAATTESAGVSRRTFVSLAALPVAAGLAKAQQKLIADGGLADIADKQKPERTTPLTPPGSLSASNMARHCTGCQLCVVACPSQVLRPSGRLLTLMQPEMSFERGYCLVECTKCSEVCPTKAITKITPADRSAIHAGRALWVKERCVVNTDSQPCDNCARHCPTNAITMLPNPDAPQEEPQSGGFRPPRRPLLIPVIDDEKCIGCGACENLCPSRPVSAIFVEGCMMHRIV